jgi:glycosyltransferase involved in cell wall biosynthesis
MSSDEDGIAASMKVLVVHNHYRSSIPSGENRVVADECDALGAAGVAVETFFRSSDELEALGVVAKAKAATSPITGWSSKPELRDMLQRFAPDVVHLHNPYPLISPRVVDMASERRIPVVATIHNFRLQCLNGLMYRDGHICTECEGKSFARAGIVHSCYRGSLPQSALMATALRVHRRRWDGVDRFIAVSEFVAARLESWGVASSRVTVKPNPVPDPGPVSPVGRGFLFAGRLTQEKGILLLLDAWERSGLDGSEDLLIAGDGPLLEQVRRRARGLRSVTLLGVLDRDGIADARRRAAVGVTCSLWFEAHPAVAESFAHGRPVIATNVGALGRIVDESVGWSVDPTADGLSQALVAACDRDAATSRGLSARHRYEHEYRPDVVIGKLVDIYESVAVRR